MGSLDGIWQYQPADLVDAAGLHILLNHLADSTRVRLEGVAYREAAGKVTIPSVAAGGSVSVEVAFPPGRFTALPLVTLATTNGRLTLSYGSVSLGGCTIQANNWTAAASPTGASVIWHAVQMTPTTAEG